MGLRHAVVGLSALATLALATDYACFTGSSLYERVPKVCNQDMPITNPFDVDESPDTWFCSVTKVTEMGISDERSPPYIWSCATPKQCNATCTYTQPDPSEDAVPVCGGYFGEEGDGFFAAKASGVEVKTWCQPALNNLKKPFKLSWQKGGSLPPALTLDLPFYDIEAPHRDLGSKNAASANRQVSVLGVVAVACLAGLALRYL